MYRETSDANVIERISDSASIPRDPENRDYQAYLEWLKDQIPTLPQDVGESDEGA